MQYLLRILFLILFLVINFSKELITQDLIKSANLVILDKTSSTKYNLSIKSESKFRSLHFEILSCNNHQFEKYLDQIALIRIKNYDEIFTGWFFSKTVELNNYSNKIYEISLIDCSS